MEPQAPEPQPPPMPEMEPSPEPEPHEMEPHDPAPEPQGPAPAPEPQDPAPAPEPQMPASDPQPQYPAPEAQMTEMEPHDPALEPQLPMEPQDPASEPQPPRGRKRTIAETVSESDDRALFPLPSPLRLDPEIYSSQALDEFIDRCRIQDQKTALLFLEELLNELKRAGLSRFMKEEPNYRRLADSIFGFTGETKV